MSMLNKTKESKKKKKQPINDEECELLWNTLPEEAGGDSRGVLKTRQRFRNIIAYTYGTRHSRPHVRAAGRENVWEASC